MESGTPTQIDFIRSAMFIPHYAGATIPSDPMFNPAGAVDPVANTPNLWRNPTVDSLFDETTLRERRAALDGVLVTHLLARRRAPSYAPRSTGQASPTGC